MKNVAFVDLDKTLIFSKRSYPETVGDAVTCFQREDEPSRGCWMPKSYLDMLLDLHAEIVIVTARSKDDIDKLSLPFNVKYTICNFGAVTYRGNNIVGNNLTESDVLTMEKFQKDRTIHETITPTKIHYHGNQGVVFHYVFSNKDNAVFYENFVKSIIKANGDYRALTTQRNGRHFDIFPASCLKENAVKLLINEVYNSYFKLGFGDSIIDHGFMALCDLAVTSTQSQLFKNIGEI